MGGGVPHRKKLQGSLFQALTLDSFASAADKKGKGGGRQQKTP